MNWQNTRKDLLEQYYPGKDEIENVKQIYSTVSEFIEDEYDLDTSLAGSSGRETFVSGEGDVDVFVLFPEETDPGDLEERGLEIGRSVFDHLGSEAHTEYAEHPYTKGKHRGVEVEVVPCIDTDPENIRTAVDRSPHHARWVGSRLDERQKKDVVLLKRFLDANGLYGSSLKVRGFSGYLCELLVVHYGDLRSVLEAAEDWERQEILDPARHGTASEVLKEDSGNLVVVDPVDPERNVSSVLTDENVASFIFAAQRFNQNPDKSFFEEESLDVDRDVIEKEISRRADVIALEFGAPDQPEDITYPQMRKLMQRLSLKLSDVGFDLYTYGFEVFEEKILVVMELERHIRKTEIMEGPSIYHGKNYVRSFQDEHEDVFVRGERLVAKTEREFKDAEKLLEDFLRQEPQKLSDEGVPDDLAEDLSDFDFVDPLESGKSLKMLAELFNV